MMKVIVKCENCGNEVEITPGTQGNVADFSRALIENDFYYSDAKIKLELQQEVVTDIDDVDKELQEIRIDCRNCGEYIQLDF